MVYSIKIGIWNANGFAQRSREIKFFLYDQDIDIMLIAETHFTKKSYMHIPRYNVYSTQHPDGKAHGGTAVIIKNKIKRYENTTYNQDHLQTTCITIQDRYGPITIAAIYSPPKHIIKQEQYTRFFATLGNRFVAGGDFNAKHPWWGSRSNVSSPKERQLCLSMIEDNLHPVSTDELPISPLFAERFQILLTSAS